MENANFSMNKQTFTNTDISKLTIEHQHLGNKHGVVPLNVGVQLVWFASLIGLAVEIIGITRLGQPFRSFGIYNIFAPWVLRGMMSKTGWWFQPLWKMLFSWDDYSQYMEKEKLFQTTNQKIVLYPIWSWIETTNELFTFDIFWTRCRNRASWVSETQKQCQFTESLSI